MLVLRTLRKWLFHSRIMVLCSRSDAQLWRLYGHILLLYTSVEFMLTAMKHPILSKLEYDGRFFFNQKHSVQS